MLFVIAMSHWPLDCSVMETVTESPGATPSEIVAATRAGADLVKIFPADCIGGPHFVRQMLGPFPDARFMVSGGVDENNVKQYAALGVTGICIASAALTDALRKNGRAGVTGYVRSFVHLLEPLLEQHA